MPYLQLDQTLINLKCHEHPLRAIVGAKELGRELKEIGSAASLLAAGGMPRPLWPQLLKRLWEQVFDFLSLSRIDVPR